MKRTLIACAMMEREIHEICRKKGCEIPIIWVERGYHNTPGKLREKLQSMIDGLQNQDEILLGFGLCGNGTAGLVSSKAVLVLPKFDDCINLLLCRGNRRSRGLTEVGGIYLTEGWTKDQEAILQQYETYVSEYGKEAAEDIMGMMYRHYEKIFVIDTKCGDITSTQKYAQKAAKLLDLSTETVDGSTGILEKLLTGEWEDDFIVQKPGNPTHSEQWDFPAKI